MVKRSFYENVVRPGRKFYSFVLIMALVAGVVLPFQASASYYPVTTLATGFSKPIGVAVDGSGNIYVADTYNSAIKKMDSSGNNIVTLGSGISYPVGIALDKTGNIYVIASNGVMSMDSSGKNIKTLFTNFGFDCNPQAIAVDGSGNIIITTVSNGPFTGNTQNYKSNIIKMDSNGKNAVTLVSDRIIPWAVTTDVSGNIYFGDGQSGSIKKIDSTGNITSIRINGGAQGLAMDSGGNLYEADYGAKAVYKMDTNGKNAVCLANGFSNPKGLAVDSAGNVYVADTDANAIKKINVSTTPSPSPSATTPTVTTLAATDIMSTSATLKGILSPADAFNMGCLFWGTDPGSVRTPVKGNADGNGNITGSLTGLTPGTTYYYRMSGILKSSGEAVYGSILSFTTAKETSSSPSLPTQGLIAEYKFDGDFKEASGSGMDGTAIGNVSFADDGVSGKCAVFNHGYLNVINGSLIDPGKQFTITAWIKLDVDAQDGSNPVAYKFLPTETGSTMETFSAIAGGTNSLELLQHSVMDDNSTNVSSTTAENLALADGWTHVAFVCDGNYEYIYVAGVLKSSEKIDADTLKGSFNSDGDFLIGGDSGNDTFLGKMDDLRVYNCALSGSDIAALASTGSYLHHIIFQLLNCDMTVDGKVMQIDPSNTGVYPYIDGGRTMVPLRAIVESMGGTINWDASDQRVDITLNSNTIQLWINNTNATVNGKQVTMEVPAKSVEGRTMVPVRFVAENLGAKVDWDGATQKITISF